MDYIAELRKGLLDLQSEMIARVGEDETPDTVSRLVTGGYVVGFIEDTLSKLDRMNPDSKGDLNNTLSRFPGALRAQRDMRGGSPDVS